MFVLGLMVVLALPCAFLCAALARPKTGASVEWFVFGLFFGLLAVVLAILMPFDPLHQDERRKARDREAEIARQKEAEPIPRTATGVAIERTLAGAGAALGHARLSWEERREARRG
jgi:hypothetical protein